MMKELDDLCITAIEYMYGNLCSKIVSSQQKRNKQDIPSQSNSIGYNIDTVAECLQSQIQHDMVRIYEPHIFDCKPTQTAQAAERRIKQKEKKQINIKNQRYNNNNIKKDIEIYDSNTDDSSNEDDSATVKKMYHPSIQFGDISAGIKPYKRNICKSRIYNSLIVSNEIPGYMQSGKYVYGVDRNMILGSLRYPEYQTIISSRYGYEAHIILEEFCTYGKQTLSQVIHKIYNHIEVDSMMKNVNNTTDSTGTITNNNNKLYITMDMLNNIESQPFTQILEIPKKFRDKQDNNESITQEEQDEYNSTQKDTIDINENKKKEENILKRVKDIIEILIELQYIIPSTNIVPTIRHKQQNILNETSSSFIDTLEKKQSNNNSNTNTNNEITKNYEQNLSYINVPYIINHDRFTIIIRDEQIVEYIQHRVGVKQILQNDTNEKQLEIAPSTIIKCMLQSYDNNNNNNKFTVLQVYEQVMRHIYQVDMQPSNLEQNMNKDINTIQFWQDEMATEVFCVLIRQPIDENICTYSIAFEILQQQIRLEQAQAIVTERCGILAGRFFRLLSQKGRLEEKTIAEYGFVPKKEAKEVLCSMYKERFVEQQEVCVYGCNIISTLHTYYYYYLQIPRTSDRQPSKAFFTWSIPHETLKNVQQSILFTSYTNIRTRLSHETYLVQELLDKVCCITRNNDKYIYIYIYYIRKYITIVLGKYVASIYGRRTRYH